MRSRAGGRAGHRRPIREGRTRTSRAAPGAAAPMGARAASRVSPAAPFEGAARGKAGRPRAAVGAGRGDRRAKPGPSRGARQRWTWRAGRCRPRRGPGIPGRGRRTVGRGGRRRWRPPAGAPARYGGPEEGESPFQDQWGTPDPSGTERAVTGCSVRGRRNLRAAGMASRGRRRRSIVVQPHGHARARGRRPSLLRRWRLTTAQGVIGFDVGRRSRRSESRR